MLWITLQRNSCLTNEACLGLEEERETEKVSQTPVNKFVSHTKNTKVFQYRPPLKLYGFHTDDMRNIFYYIKNYMQ